MAAVIFDCDGTLSQLEGINELARWNQVIDEVGQLTEQAMGQVGMTPEIYQSRLALVQPTRQQLEKLGQDYFDQRAQDLDQTLVKLREQGIEIYVVSAGMNPSVKIFAGLLNIPEANVFAVDLEFDANGSYLGFNHNSPMTKNNGKRAVVEQIKKMHNQIYYIGDGMNDLQVKDLVTTFVGYGGVFYRENIAKAADVYLTDPSMLQLVDVINS